MTVEIRKASILDLKNLHKLEQVCFEQDAWPLFDLVAVLSFPDVVRMKAIEAKRMGMKVGMSVQDAREKVPSAVFVQNDPAKYRAVTSRVFSKATGARPSSARFSSTTFQPALSSATGSVPKYMVLCSQMN